jgi:hypothetical protein
MGVGRTGEEWIGSMGSDGSGGSAETDRGIGGWVEMDRGDWRRSIGRMGETDREDRRIDRMREMD